MQLVWLGFPVAFGCALLAGCKTASLSANTIESARTPKQTVPPAELRARRAHPDCADGNSLRVEWVTEDVTPGWFTLACTRPSGERDGPAAIWLDSGAKFAFGDFLRGVKDGQWLWIYPNGSRKSERSYRAGKLQGPVRKWHPNGTLASTGSFKDGLKHGVFASYSRNGTRTEAVPYENGRRHGLSTVWNESGAVSGTVRYENDQLVPSTNPDEIRRTGDDLFRDRP